MTDKKAEMTRASETKPVVDLLASILSEVQKQVVGNTPKPMEGEAVRAVEQFREIGGALSLTPLPTITLKAEPAAHGVNGGISKLTWTATDALSVTFDQGIGVVSPTSEGAISVNVTTTTTFTATARGRCGSAAASVTVLVATLG